ncbi:MAG: hypothetical protein Q9195_004019 [Heterodermia aff. obscurata]
MADIDKLCAQLDHLRENVIEDEASRKKLMEAAHNLSLALEKPGDTIQRIAYLVGLFKTSNGLWPGDKWAATNISKALTLPGIKAGVNHNFETIMPCFQQLPQFLLDTHYQNPSDSAHTPFQRAHNTDQPPFVWILSHPFNFDSFIQWMTAQHEGQPTWLDVFPLEARLRTNDIAPETPLFVDVGGGVGHQCAALKARFPHLRGRVILQDLPQTLPQAIPTPGVEATAHDFWTPQPVKGTDAPFPGESARAYYLRNIMHDYPDEKCIQILQQLKPAMSPDSVLLIDEMVLPNQGSHWLAATLDLMVMSSLGAMERSEKQWQQLLDAAGFKVQSVFTYTEELRDSVIVAVPK